MGAGQGEFGSCAHRLGTVIKHDSGIGHGFRDLRTTRKGGERGQRSESVARRHTIGGCSCEILSGLPFWQLASSSCGTTHAEHPLPQRNGLTATVSKLFTLSKLLTRLEFYRFCFTATCRQPRCALLTRPAKRKTKARRRMNRRGRMTPHGSAGLLRRAGLHCNSARGRA